MATPPFDPNVQNVTFLAADGLTPIAIPLAAVDAINHESFSVCINYGVQLGACVAVLVFVLLVTPAAKLRRPSSLLHVLGLLICTIRMALLAAFFPSPFNDFYAFWAGDYSAVPARDFAISIAGNVFSMLLLIVVEAALMHQAWTMVSLWPSAVRLALCFLSVTITLITVGFRFASTIIQSRAVLSLEPPQEYLWLIQWMAITNAISICWFCALFNAKLVLHLVTNRRILPSYKTLSPMEILVMTNGILMIVPVIFTGLQWGHFTNFEAASLTLTSVAVILPLGTIAAQRMASSGSNISYPTSGASSGAYRVGDSNSAGSSAPLKKHVGSFSSRGTATILSRCEASSPDLEMGRLGPSFFSSSQRDLINGHVRVDRELQQRVDKA
ncbi:fungal pheromone mating factor STE2 GPCR-domain-containing protein [Stachybotrys elegans]|uniref:Fungal pheromone mating factor STE2 GPCR-domain-containing protein n=1 Tax=Stachybotrys elegans TaxID=80388 RepID=A0A8K0SLH5_9HYPO|nr:fungal pheromone mating factor STE2 GPCR-domain-containing protein [Stachybotrys elegans]